MTVRRLAAVLAAATFALVTPPAMAATGPGIVGGQPADIAASPWVVALVDQDGYPFCDGTLIGPTTVLTAAHCLAGRTAAQVQVVGGRTDLDQVTAGDSVSGVREMTVPSGFVAPQRGDDMGTLTLADPFPYRPLPLATTDYPAGTVGTVYGWGGASTDPATATTVLHAVRVPLVADRTCANLVDRYVEGASYDSATMLCAGGKGVGTCVHDDGGPLVVDGTLVGIASWTIGCGQHPDFYTKVSGEQ